MGMTWKSLLATSWARWHGVCVDVPGLGGLTPPGYPAK